MGQFGPRRVNPSPACEEEEKVELVLWKEASSRVLHSLTGLGDEDLRGEKPSLLVPELLWHRVLEPGPYGLAQIPEGGLIGKLHGGLLCAHPFREDSVKKDLDFHDPVLYSLFATSSRPSSRSFSLDGHPVSQSQCL